MWPWHQDMQNWWLMQSACAYTMHPCVTTIVRLKGRVAKLVIYFSKPDSLHGSSPRQPAAGRPKGGPQSCGSDAQSHPAAGMYLQRSHPSCSPAKKRREFCSLLLLHARPMSGLVGVCVCVCSTGIIDLCCFWSRSSSASNMPTE